MKNVVFPLLLVLFACPIQAQTKVFKEISDDISTQFKAITQDNNLVGYLAFTRLEKADADSFNYRVTIMDENLKDIGKVEFRQENLELQTVSFEQNLLCLGYIQSSLSGVQKIRTVRGYRKFTDAATSSHMLIQFINLSGKIINTYYQEVNLEAGVVSNRNPYAVLKLIGYLKYGMQIRNIPNSGFCLFYGDNFKQDLVLFDTRGVLTHKQEIPTLADHYFLRASATDIYLLTKKDVRVPEGGNKLY
ncbi:MAG TPA: DUF6770 family protein, partial [Puia sp.]|nr:DUF6770 family protein [Puia sp.]